MSGDPEKLKVGLVTPYPWTSVWGVNRHVRGLASSLASRGHDVTVIAPAEEREEARAARKKARAARRAARKPGAGRKGGPEKRARAGDMVEGASLIRISGTFRMPYSDSLANLTLPLEVTDQMEETLSRERFDILHLHEPFPPSLSFAGLRLARCPTVATFHTSGERFLSYQLMRPVVERFFSRLDGRICASQNTRRIVSGYFPAGYDVIPTGIDLSRFSLPEEEERPAAPPLVIFAAWTDPRKGLALLMRAVRMLPTDIPRFELAIAGGEELSWRANLIVPRRLRDRISFQGPIPPDRLAAEYRRCEILCAPYAATSLASAVLEAMASGSSVILPAQAGFRELVGEGLEGLMLDHPYPYNLAADLVDLLVNPRQRRSMGAAAARRARRHDWGKISTQVERIYRRAHQRRRARPGKLAIQETGSKMILADLHIHTCYSSDCATTPEELMAACEECGLEAIAVTDHNTIKGALAVAALAPAHIHVIIGEEIKTTRGEVIGLYLSEEIPRGLSFEETIREIKNQGGLVYVPHPFDPLHLTPTYKLLASNAADIDIIEVYNPRITFTSFNEKAKRLALKYDIPGGAGSDCHVLQGVGTAMLSLHQFKTPSELLASLRGADIIRSSKSPLYLHSLKLLKNSREAVVNRQQG